MNKTTINPLDDCRVIGAEGEVFAAFVLPKPDEWSTLAVGQLLSALISASDDGNRHIETVTTGDGRSNRRALLVCARARVDQQGTPETRFDDDLRELVSTAKRYGITPVGRERAEGLTVYLGFEAQIKRSEKL